MSCGPVSPSAVCAAVADPPPFILHTTGRGLSSLLSLRDNSLHCSQAPANNKSLISSGSKGQKPNSLRSNLFFTVHSCKFLSFHTCRTDLPFRPKHRTGRDTGDTVTCTALPKLLSQLLTPWWNLHFLPTKPWLTSLSTTVKMTIVEKKEFLHHQFFQESAFLFILQVTATDLTKYQPNSSQFSKENLFIFPRWFINFKAQTIFSSATLLTFKNSLSPLPWLMRCLLCVSAHVLSSSLVLVTSPKTWVQLKL